jgi:hypothetical protein
MLEISDTIKSPSHITAKQQAIEAKQTFLSFTGS